MLRFKEFLKESQWMYHGTTKDFESLAPDRNAYMIDRAIGSHFSADPEMAKKFSEGLYSKSKEKSPPIMIKTKTPPRSQLVKLPFNARTDQSAMANFVASTVFSHPDGKDLFKSWAKESRGVDDNTAELIHKKLSNNESMSDKTRFGTAAAQANTFKSYLNSYGFRTQDPFLKRKVVDKFLDIMREQGIKGLVYKNTSPRETENIRSPKCYVMFHPEEHPQQFFKNEKEMHPGSSGGSISAEEKFKNELMSGDFSNIHYAKEHGIWDPELHGPIANRALKQKVENGRYSMPELIQAKKHGIWDEELHGMAKSGFSKKLESGNWYSPEIDDAKELGLWDPKIHIKSAVAGLAHKLSTGNYVYADIDHAKENGYYVPEIHDKLR